MSESAGVLPEVRIHVPPRDALAPAFAENNVPVFFGCDDNFFNHTVTAIASLLEHASPANNYDIIIIQRGVPREKLARAAAWVGKYANASLRFVDIGVKMAMADGGAFHITRSFNLAVYYRIFAPRVFAKYPRITYLDSDILVLADIAEFCTLDLGDKLLAACHDVVSERQSLSDPERGKFWREKMGMRPGDEYFMSSQLAMNLAEMRRQGVERTIIERIKATGGSNLPDQDILNAVLHGRVRFAGHEWNYLDWMADPGEGSVNYSYLPPESVEEIRALRDRYKLLHYVERKPWSVDYMGTNADLYWKYAAKTPFLDESMAGLARRLTLPKYLWRYFRLSVQTLNFRLRGLLSRASAAKCASRAENMRRRLNGLKAQRARVKRWRAGAKAESTAVGGSVQQDALQA